MTNNPNPIVLVPRKVVDDTIAWFRTAPLESGYCCCGDKVDAHNIGSGHSPVDDLAHSAGQVEERLIQALSTSTAPATEEAALEAALQELDDIIRADVPRSLRLSRLARAFATRTDTVDAFREDNGDKDGRMPVEAPTAPPVPEEAARLIERLRVGVMWSNGEPIGAVVGEVNDPVMRQAADMLAAFASQEKGKPAVEGATINGLPPLSDEERKAAIEQYATPVANTSDEREDEKVNGRDIWEVANQLSGYVDTGTDRELAEFLLRESEAATDLAKEIRRLRAALSRGGVSLPDREEVARVIDPEAFAEPRRIPPIDIPPRKRAARLTADAILALRPSRDKLVEGLKAARDVAVHHSNYGHIEGNKRAFTIAADIERRIAAIGESKE